MSKPFTYREEFDNIRNQFNTEQWMMIESVINSSETAWKMINDLASQDSPIHVVKFSDYDNPKWEKIADVPGRIGMFAKEKI